MKNRANAVYANSIPYIKALRTICGSVTASILFQQLDFRWAQATGEELYKFLEPCDHPKCRPGDDWCSELGFSAEEFLSAFAKIGVRYSSKTSWQRAVQGGSEFTKENGSVALYCSYFDRNLGLTFYRRNHPVADAAINSITHPSETGKVGLRETDNHGLQKPGKSVYRNRESRFANKEADNTQIPPHIVRTEKRKKFTNFEDERAQVRRLFGGQLQ